MSDSPEDKNNRLVDNRKSASEERKQRKQSGDQKPGQPGGGWPRRNLMLVFAVVAASLLLVNVLDSGNRADEYSYTEFRRLLADSTWPVTSVTITRVSEGYEVEGERRATTEESA